MYRIFLWSEMSLMLQMGSSNQLIFVLLLVCPSHRGDLYHQKTVTASAELNIYLIKIVALQKCFLFLCTGIRIYNHYENWKRTCAIVLLTLLLLHYQRRRHYCLIEESKFKYRNKMGEGD